MVTASGPGAGAPGVSGGLGDLRLQVAALLAAVLLVGGWHWENDGLWFQGDAPRHAATGLFLWDALTTWPAAPLDYALRYYARYPALVLGVYPPLFHLLEGLAFGIAGPTPWAAKTLVLASAGVLGLYTTLWARRLLGAHAGWAGAVVVCTPALVRYANGVLLNVPATALVLAALHHLRLWLDGGSRRQGIAAAALSLAAALTYYPAAIVVPMAGSWLLVSHTRRRWQLLLGPAIAVAIVAGALAILLPDLFARHAPSPSRFLSPINWRFYGAHVGNLLGPLWVLAAAGAAWALVMARRRPVAAEIVLPATAALAALALLPARDERYALILVPLGTLAAFAALDAVVARLGPWQRVARGVAIAGVLVLSVRTASATPVPRLTGIDDVARFLAERAPHDAVLYSGIYDGVFAFYVRAFDPRFERRVVFANRVLYQWRQADDFTWHETPYVSTAADVAPLLEQRSGCQWVAVEIGGEFQLAATERLLRDALAGPAFERVASFPVAGKPVSRIDLYRVRAPVAPAPPLDLSFASFSGRVFSRVEPIPSRP